MAGAAYFIPSTTSSFAEFPVVRVGQAERHFTSPAIKKAIMALTKNKTTKNWRGCSTITFRIRWIQPFELLDC